MRIKPTLSRAAAILFSVATVGAVATPLRAQARPSDADLQAVESFHLTVPVLARLAQVQENMYAAAKAHPDLMKRYASQQGDDGQDAATIDQMAKKLDRMPEMKAAVIKAGFTPRDYMIATIATFQAAMTSAMLDMPGADKSRVPANARANADFLKAHAAELQRMQARSMELQKLMKQQSGERDDSSDTARDTTRELP